MKFTFVIQPMAVEIHASSCARVGLIKSFATYEIEAPDIFGAIVTDVREFAGGKCLAAEYNVLPCANPAGLKIVPKEVDQ